MKNEQEKTETKKKKNYFKRILLGVAAVVAVGAVGAYAVKKRGQIKSAFDGSATRCDRPAGFETPQPTYHRDNHRGNRHNSKKN